jgi:hypothetical protein
MYGYIWPELVGCFRRLEEVVPPPREVPYRDGWTYRFVERLPQQAILAKLSRVASGIRAERALLGAGCFQEASALQRILDELDSDIMFLSGPLIFGTKEPAHDEYLADFFQEEFDEGKTALESEQKRRRVPRRKIRAYNARMFMGAKDEVHHTSAVLETIDNAYSGFIHAAAVHALDSYGGDPPHFHIEGLMGTSRLDDCWADFRNYLHRGLLAGATAAKALGEEATFLRARDRSNSVAMQFEMISRR